MTGGGSPEADRFCALSEYILIMKNKKIKLLRRAAGVFAATLICLALSGCGFVEIIRPSDTGESVAVTDPPTVTAPPPAVSSGEPNGTQTEPPKPVTFPDRIAEAEERLAALPEVPLTTRGLIIANSTATGGVIQPWEWDILNTARSKRTEMACERYGIEISTVSADDNAMLAEFLTSKKSGQYYADLAVIPAMSAASYYNSDVSLDLRGLPFFEAPNDPSVPEGAGVAGPSCYFYCGAAVLDPDSMWALYFDRTIAGDELTNTLYRTALGETGLVWEDIFTAVASCTLPEGGYAAVSGTYYTTDFLADAACVSAGIDFVSGEASKAPYIAYDEQKYTAAGALITRLSGILYIPENETSADPTDIFSRGKALFRFGPLSDMRLLFDKKTEWGLLPMPRTDQVSGNVTLGDGYRPVIVFTGGGSRLDLCGATLSALDAASGTWMCDEYAKAAFENYLRDNNSYFTLRAILDGAVEFDFSSLYSGTTDKLAAASFGAARAQLRGGTELAAAVSAAKAAADRQLARMFG